MRTAQEIPGLRFVGYFCDPEINNGEPTPRYEFAPPPPGKLSINTLEGWTAMVNAHNESCKARGLPYTAQINGKWEIVDPRKA